MNILDISRRIACSLVLSVHARLLALYITILPNPRALYRNPYLSTTIIHLRSATEKGEKSFIG